jgi:hypothetical protein
MKGNCSGALTMWIRVLDQLKKDMVRYDLKPDSFTIPHQQAKHEQEILAEDVLPSMLRKGELRVLHLDRCLYTSGQWYIQRSAHIKMCGSTVPSVLNNNWIVGNMAKIQRAEQNNHWFLMGYSPNATCLNWKTRLAQALRTFSN